MDAGIAHDGERIVDMPEEPRPRRGRPSRKEAGEIDRDVLEAARLRFVAHGFDGTTMEAVAEGAGVTKKTLYLRYPDKGALLRAVLHDRLTEWSARSHNNDWMMGQNVDQKLRYLARSILKQAQDPEIKSFVKLVDGSFGWAQSIGQEFQSILRRPMLDILAQVISAEADTGGRAMPPQAAAAIFLGMLSAYPLVTGEGESDEATLDTFADHVTDVFLKGRAAW